MCRSTVEGGRRCPCEQPEPRRARQNLSYHMRKGIVAAESGTALAEQVLDKGQDTVSQDTQSRAVENVVALVTNYRESVRSYTNWADWVLDGEEATPENQIAGKKRREAEISALGSIMALRAQEIAGLSYDEAQNQMNAVRAQEAKSLIERKLAEKRYDAAVKRIGDLYGPATEEMALAKDHSLEKRDRAYLRHFDAQNERRTLATELREKFAQAHRQVIAEVREVGEKPDVEHAHKELREGFSGIISQVFPSDWVKQSNSESPIQLKSSPHRAHYSFNRGGTQRVKKRVLAHGKKSRFEFGNPSKGPHPDDIRYQDWVKDEETDTWSGPLRTVDYPEKWRYDSNGDRVPVGRWQRGLVEIDEFNRNEGKWEYYLEERWVRDIYHTEVNSVPAKPVIRMNGYSTKYKSIGSQNEFDRVAVHEFSHRVESNNHHITAMEATFLARRTTHEDGTRDPLVSYLGKKDEHVREDSFVSVYMGKEYPSSRHLEILSMGSESVFCGTHGGLLGLGENEESRSDRDYLNFILGTYATL